jgi:hypothetical protein
MSTFGIVSEDANSVAMGNDILGGVYLPTFLFFDCLIADTDWRNYCLTTRVRVGTQHPNNEVAAVENNIRLHDHDFC